MTSSTVRVPELRDASKDPQFSASFFVARGSSPLASPCPLSNFNIE